MITLESYTKIFDDILINSEKLKVYRNVTVKPSIEETYECVSKKVVSDPRLGKKSEENLYRYWTVVKLNDFFASVIRKHSVQARNEARLNKYQIWLDYLLEGNYISNWCEFFGVKPSNAKRELTKAFEILNAKNGTTYEYEDFKVVQKASKTRSNKKEMKPCVDTVERQNAVEKPVTEEIERLNARIAELEALCASLSSRLDLLEKNGVEKSEPVDDSELDDILDETESVEKVEPEVVENDEPKAVEPKAVEKDEGVYPDELEREPTVKEMYELFVNVIPKYYAKKVITDNEYNSLMDMLGRDERVEEDLTADEYYLPLIPEKYYLKRNKLFFLVELYLTKKGMITNTDRDYIRHHTPDYVEYVNLKKASDYENGRTKEKDDEVDIEKVNNFELEVA